MRAEGSGGGGGGSRRGGKTHGAGHENEVRVDAAEPHEDGAQAREHREQGLHGRPVRDAVVREDAAERARRADDIVVRAANDGAHDARPHGRDHALHGGRVRRDGQRNGQREGDEGDSDARSQVVEALAEGGPAPDFRELGVEVIREGEHLRGSSSGGFRRWRGRLKRARCAPRPTRDRAHAHLPIKRNRRVRAAADEGDVERVLLLADGRRVLGARDLR